MKKVYLYLTVVLAFTLSLAACSNLDESAYKLSTNTGAVTILSNKFDTSLGGFTLYSVLGDQTWKQDSTYNCMTITGYVSATKTYVANEDWLISPTIDLTNYSTFNVSFDHAGKLLGNPLADATIWVSDNYVAGLPGAATWTQLTIPTMFTNTDYTFVNSGQISLTAFAGKKIKIAFKYLSTTLAAGTWEVKNLLVQTGEAIVVDYGKGTEGASYTVQGASANQTSANAWVKGYIVGYVWSGTQNAYSFSSDTCTMTSNILIADSMRNIYISRCLAVQLPIGAVRNGLNLQSNKSLIGKKVTLYGALTNYYGGAGLKNVSYYKLDDGTSGGTKPVDISTAILYESFASSLGSFSQYSVSGAQIWAWSTYKCALASGYANSTRYVNEDWLISPAIDLSKVSTSTLAFTHAGKYFNNTESANCTLYASKDYVSGNPNTATWTQLTIPTYDKTNLFTFTSSGDIDLKSFVGSSAVHVAFVYKSDGTTTGTGNWEIKDVVVY